ncbi:MAG TPA: hydrogenase nickel incorporation protein HypB [Opitutaceae bacterium]|jgi:hydrogenase nickel incorporation protein HypB|nr:hydrogenase nickel incorporation protein HypB [Opitutaceae bacterium]
MIQTIHAQEEVTEAEMEENLFDANDAQADSNRRVLEKSGTRAIDIMGAIGSGKTTLVTRMVERMSGRARVAVINGDPVTADDVLPIERQGVPVIQIAANACHLDADLVSRAYAKLPIGELDLILIENVGNLICPAEFKLGSNARVVVISVTEGPWMVRKHPRMFLGARLVVINKLDFAGPMGVDVDQLERDVHMLKPDLKVIKTSCKAGTGLDELADALLAL